MPGRAPVLSLGKLAPGQQAYYVDSVARGLEEYYTGAKEAPGQWAGASAGRLGLAGEVDADTLARVLDNEHPTEGWRLSSSRSAPVVAGFDATFCAPKSVSLLFALGTPEVSNEVRNGHDAALAAAFGVFEGVACRVRRGKGGQRVLDGDGFVAAEFRHRTSRAAEPHLHTHVVIANLARCETDGRWTALDGRPLYAWAAPVGHLYEAQLRWELTHRLGVGWTPVKNGIADIAGIPQPLLREFSTRRQQIEARLAESGGHSARAAQLAAYATRTAKDPNLEAGSLLPVWWERAEAHGFDRDRLAAVLDRTASLEPPAPDSEAADRLYEWLAGPEGLTDKRATFGERDVIKAICNALPAGGRVEDVLALVDGFLRTERVVALVPDDSTATIRRADGVVVTARLDETRWTTHEMLEIEQRLLASAVNRRAGGFGVAAPSTIGAAVTARPSLTAEQAAMVKEVCGSGDGVSVVEGVAGAGKTFALAAAREAWSGSGHRVLGCSLAARAAKQLEQDAGIPSTTLDRLLGRLDRRAEALDERTVAVVDEAAMVGTRKLARLLDHAEHAGAKVVLVGDPCQLPEIDAGGAFRGLRCRLGASHLAENRRQQDQWERDALAELRSGDADQAVDAYLGHARVHVGVTEHEAREQLVEAWMAARASGDDVLMVAGRLADVDDLNQRARASLRRQGQLGDDQVALAGRGFTEGDQVLALRNDHRVGILNGTRATIERIDTTRHELTLGNTSGHDVVVPFSYGVAGHLTHGYATTIHKAQGATVDRCLVLLDETAAREDSYVALSRGRKGNDVFMAGRDCRAEERHSTEPDADPLDDLRRAVRRSGAKRMASDELPPPRRHTAELVNERDALRQRLAGGPPDVSVLQRGLTDERAAALHRRAGVESQLDAARYDLDALGTLKRRLQGTRRRELEARVDRLEANLGRCDVTVAETDRQLAALEPAMRRRSEWAEEHGDELRRLADLELQIGVAGRLERTTRVRELPALEQDFGIGW